MNNIVLLIIILVSTFTSGYLFGSKVEEYNHAIDKVQAVSQTLKQERAKQDAKDKELAEKTGLQREHISKIERGIIDMRVSATLVPILKALNLKFEKLYEFDE